MDRDLLAALVGSASTPGSADRRPLTRLSTRLWPADSDATVPAARDWLRRWSPRSLVAEPPLCACTDGRCETCN